MTPTAAGFEASPGRYPVRWPAAAITAWVAGRSSKSFVRCDAPLTQPTEGANGAVSDVSLEHSTAVAALVATPVVLSRDRILRARTTPAVSLATARRVSVVIALFMVTTMRERSFHVRHKPFRNRADECQS